MVGGKTVAGQQPRIFSFRFLDSGQSGHGDRVRNATRQFAAGGTSVLDQGAEFIYIQLTIDFFALYTWPSMSLPPSTQPDLVLVDSSSGWKGIAPYFARNGPVFATNPSVLISPA
jgi:hypothetical protein